MSRVRASSTERTSLGFFPEEKRIMKLDYALMTTTEALSGFDLKYYEAPNESITRHKETKLRGWLNESEHPDGILSKACPECGYKYGSAWNFVEVPEDVISFLNTI